jgi:NADP-dependent 3-hydroxy acid dehydrogenase YdfG/acyl carrier protein
VAPDDIGYVEGHGTATQVGDAIELRALAETFGRAAATAEPPVLGAAKAHIGHLDAAAGVAGLIKTVLALQDGMIPPALHPGPPHPGLAASGFVLAKAVRPWPRRSGPRRAGVSAFGLGGTNAHVVLEQAPAPPPRRPLTGPHHLVLTARTRDGLAELSASMRDWLKARPDADLGDLAHTLAQGRMPQPWRRAITASTTAQAIAVLAEPLPDQPPTITWPAPPVGRRIAAPTTPFERVRHWLDATPASLPQSEQLLVAGWRNQPAAVAEPRGPWLIMATGRRAASLADALRHAGQNTEVVERPDDIPTLAARGFRPTHLLYAMALGDPPPSQDQGVVGLPAWVQALGLAFWLDGGTLLIATSHAVAVGGERRLYPEHAGLTAVPATLMAEHPGLRCACIDLGTTEDIAVRLLCETTAETPLVAWRHGRRWVRDWQPLPVAKPSSPRQGGVWLITGGTGGIGLLLARHLARTARARMILAGRTTNRPDLAAAVAEITALGGAAEAVTADLTRSGTADRLVRLTLDRFGALHGVVHAAGLAEGGMVQGLTPDSVRAHHAVKPEAALALAEALAGRPLDRFILCGSHAGVLGAFGQFGYATANAALAGVAEALCATGRREAVAVQWDRWQGVGMAIQGESRHRAMTNAPLPGGLSPDEALALFDRVLAAPLGEPVLLATSRPMAALVAERQGITPVAPPVVRQPRPIGLAPPSLPSTASQTALVALWEEELGIAPIGIDDDFVSLGGDSLNALRVCGAARARLGIVLPLRLLLDSRTIAVLAERLGDAEAPSVAGFAEEML